uniref:Uncharacterized protein n=1 Tax=Rhizophora mucronata TaxID=61149 RepID=A0A2P2PG71_RHIMU
MSRVLNVGYSLVADKGCRFGSEQHPCRHTCRGW